ncbi:hypothetical protein D3C76_1402140 [compost metagenome]
MHLSTTKVVDQGVPILVEALLWVPVLVERGAVELGQAMDVGREMRRYPIQNHTDTGTVAGIDEGGKVLGRAIARTRGEL